jgi:hypothetical protein
LKHLTTPEFWERFDRLPEEARHIARKNYDILKADPRHPSLHFKRIEAYWSVRVGLHYRALELEVEGRVLWFWIGTHAEYDRIVG